MAGTNSTKELVARYTVDDWCMEFVIFRAFEKIEKDTDART